MKFENIQYECHVMANNINQVELIILKIVDLEHVNSQNQHYF